MNSSSLYLRPFKPDVPYSLPRKHAHAIYSWLYIAFIFLRLYLNIFNVCVYGFVS